MAGQYSESWDDGQMEDARCRVLRAARNAVPMLQDALHALRNGSPDITDEFLDRTIGNLISAVADSDQIVAAARAARVEHLRGMGVVL